MAGPIAILILAAGSSSRMGDNIKQLLPWKNTTFLGHAIDQAKQVTDSVFVVLGANQNAIHKTIPSGISIVHNPNWKTGMGGSIASGVDFILKQNMNLEGLLIMTSDQPLLDAAYLDEMKTSFRTGEHKIVATAYGNRAGVPAIFHKSILTELTLLNQDYGAKHIISQHLSQTKIITASGKELDIDTLNDYNKVNDVIILIFSYLYFMKMFF